MDGWAAGGDDGLNPLVVCAGMSEGSDGRVTAYIDYGSPYAYQAWYRVAQHPDRYPAQAFDWVPASAGHLFARDGGKPNASYPNLLAYNKVDLRRWAAALEIPYEMNEVFPQRTIEAARVFHHLVARDPRAADIWTAACFRAHWVDGRDISRPTTLVALANEAQLDVDVTNAMQDPAAKQRLIEVTDAAYAAGAPGVPYFVIDGEGFWGHDRLDWVLARLAGDAAPSLR